MGAACGTNLHHVWIVSQWSFDDGLNQPWSRSRHTSRNQPRQRSREILADLKDLARRTIAPKKISSLIIQMLCGGTAGPGIEVQAHTALKQRAVVSLH